MSFWTAEHRALLAAMRAQAMIPELVQRLSLERVTASEAEVRQLQGWAESLREEPFWPQLEPLIGAPDAWPQAWEDAVAQGTSPRTDHHAALFFQRVGTQLVGKTDWAAATWVWPQAIDAWTRLFGTDYPGKLFDDLVDPATSTVDRPQLLREMLDGVTLILEQLLVESSGATLPLLNPQLPRAPLRFAWAMLRHVETATADAPDPYGTLGRLRANARTTRLEVSSQVVRRFERAVAEFDLTTATRDDLLLPVLWIATYCQATSFSEDAVTTVVSQIVDLCWGLRRVGRDEPPILAALLGAGEPFNHDLFRRLSTADSAFGHNSRCADFLVFQAESLNGESRVATLDRALRVSPNHRNALMLKSYHLLEDARGGLQEVALTIALLTSGSRARAQAKMDRVVATFQEAERLYPYNDALEEVRSDITRTADRLNLTVDVSAD